MFIVFNLNLHLWGKSHTLESYHLIKLELLMIQSCAYMLFIKTIWNTLFLGRVHFSPLGFLNYLRQCECKHAETQESSVFWISIYWTTGIRCLCLWNLSNFYLIGNVKQVRGSEKLLGFLWSKWQMSMSQGPGEMYSWLTGTCSPGSKVNILTCFPDLKIFLLLSRKVAITSLFLGIS